MLWSVSVLAAAEVPTRITPAGLAERLHGPQPPLLLDVRGEQAFRQTTLPHALSGGIDPAGFLPPGDGRPIVLILPQPEDPALIAAWARRLAAAGHPVMVLDGGLPAWQVAGLATEVPKQVYTRPGTVPFVVPRGLCEMNPPAQEFR